MAKNRLAVIGVKRGSLEQLKELMTLVENNLVTNQLFFYNSKLFYQKVFVFLYRKVEPPAYKVFPKREASRVMRQLSLSEVEGRAILELSQCASDTAHIELSSVEF